MFRDTGKKNQKKHGLWIWPKLGWNFISHIDFVTLNVFYFTSFLLFTYKIGGMIDKPLFIAIYSVYSVVYDRCSMEGNHSGIIIMRAQEMLVGRQAAYRAAEMCHVKYKLSSILKPQWSLNCPSGDKTANSLFQLGKIFYT